jgi:catechol 2,3-dioxygenase-like lactoylglutathione lyase family enzyme
MAMDGFEKINILFIAGFGPIVNDQDVSRRLYGDVLGIPFTEEDGGYLHTEGLRGANSFALWPLSQAAESCFGSDKWPPGSPTPQAWLEFDVDDVEASTAQLESLGYSMLIKNKQEPWGQTVSRFLDPQGILIGITFTPWLRTPSHVEHAHDQNK